MLGKWKNQATPLQQRLLGNGKLINDTRDWKNRWKANQKEDAQSAIMFSLVEFYIIINVFLKISWRTISGQWSPCSTCLVHIDLFSSTHGQEK